MIFELLEWCFTPASWSARGSGLLAEQIAIRHRAIRCHRAWRHHLESTKKFVNRALIPGKSVAVLGSGHLHDIDLRSLKENFEEVTLVDIVHPLEVRLMALFSRGRVRLLTADLSGALHSRAPSEAVGWKKMHGDALSSADLLVSSCLLSQLALPVVKRWRGCFPKDAVEAAAQRIRESHVEFLKSAPRAILVSDTAQRFGMGEWSPLFPKLPLPGASESWGWDIATADEHGCKDMGDEQRWVEVFLFGAD